MNLRGNSEALTRNFIYRLDGTLRLYCPLTALLLRTFRERTAPRHPSRLLAQNLIPVDEEDRWKVNAICKTGKRGEVVAAVGDRVLSWRMEGTREVKTGKGKGKSGVQRLSARSERFRCEFFVPFVPPFLYLIVLKTDHPGQRITSGSRITTSSTRISRLSHGGTIFPYRSIRTREAFDHLVWSATFVGEYDGR